VTAEHPPERLREADRSTRERAQTVFDRPLVVEAGAGTGKTGILVGRLVAWSLGPGWERAAARLRDAPDRVAAEVLARIAAITFTEAAAAEMAQRAGEALAAIEAGHVPVGVREDALPPDRDLRRARARELLGALDHLVVRTIHAFCRRLLARYPLEAGLHPGFQVDADERVRDEGTVRTRLRRRLPRRPGAGSLRRRADHGAARGTRRRARGLPVGRGGTPCPRGGALEAHRRRA
jgi:ATP-dependent exoDNAse (exonuclease V) beta subunit